MAPVRLFDSPGYLVINTNTTAIPQDYIQLKAQGYNFIINSPTGSDPDAEDQKLEKEHVLGGASKHRPLSYSEFDANFKEVYPIGSVYMNADNPANPSGLLGFGLWKRIEHGHTLMQITNGSSDNILRKFKIQSASVNSNKVELRLEGRLTPQEIEEQRRTGGSTSALDNNRLINFYPGMRIRVFNLSGGQGTVPNGIFTINSVESSSAPYDLDSRATNKSADELSENISHDQDIIRFNFSTSYTGTYNVRGASEDAYQDNAYVVFLDDTIYNSGTTRGNGSPGKLLADVDIKQTPFHSHNFDDATNAKTQNFNTGSVGRYDRHGVDSWISNSDDDWDTGKGTDTFYSSYSTADEQYKTDVSSAGSDENTTQHNNVQPYIAVHMWERIA